MKATDLRSLDWKLVGVMLVAAVCLTLPGAIGRGQILPSLPFLRRWGLEIAYGAIPFLCLPLLGENPLRYFRLGRFREVFPIFAAFLLVIVASMFWLATLKSWQGHYGGGTSHILQGPFLMRLLLTMVCGEFFFRGFLLFPLFKKFGWYALPIGVMPYAMIHVGKPLIELHGSIIFGLGLAYLAVRSGSLWYGIILHGLVNLIAPLSIALFR